MLTTWQWVFNLHPTSFVNQGIPILIQGFPGGAVDELTDENGQSEKMRCTIPNQKLYQNAQKCPKARKNQPFLTGFTGADTQIRTGDLILTNYIYACFFLLLRAIIDCCQSLMRQGLFHSACCSLLFFDLSFRCGFFGVGVGFGVGFQTGLPSSISGWKTCSAMNRIPRRIPFSAYRSP